MSTSTAYAWIARDKNTHELHLYPIKPTRTSDGKWAAIEPNIIWHSMALPAYFHPEITYDNSPVKIKLTTETI